MSLIWIIPLSENVVNRMKDPCQPSVCPQPSPPYCTCTPAEGDSRAPPRESKLPQFDTNGEQQPSQPLKEDLKRFQQEQASMQEELFQVVKREREAAAKHLKAPPPREETCTDPEKPKSAQLVRELESSLLICSIKQNPTPPPRVRGPNKEPVLQQLSLSAACLRTRLCSGPRGCVWSSPGILIVAAGITSGAPPPVSSCASELTSRSMDLDMASPRAPGEAEHHGRKDLVEGSSGD
uniref:MICOS complex subunit MIC25 n=1 Tax=Ictidomys tridecemlineatus TaxID=43179 RepID=UPI001A9FE1F6|nr:MICOS complex subunit MIC25 [Ictidomys tridecemlineatus]